MELSSEVIETLIRFGVGRRNMDDPFFNDKPPPRLGIYDLDEENLCYPLVTLPCPVPGCRFTTQSVQEQSSHYNSAHRYSCAVCRRLLPSPHLLDLHLQETHDSFFAALAEKIPSYCCYIEECKERFQNAEERFEHCVRVHKLPKDFRLEQSAAKRVQKKCKPKKKAEKIEISNQNSNTEVISSSDVDVSAVKNMSGFNLENEQKATGEKSTQSVTRDVKAPNNFSFGHIKNRTFPKPTFIKFTRNENKEKQQVDMDGIVMDLKESLPD